jgi:CelD/BcsL family acetyltransferase involved in cellulose biosynthesis
MRTTQGLKVIEFLGVKFCDTCQPLFSGSLALTAATTRSFVTAILVALPRADVLRLSKMQRDLFGRANPFATLRGTASSADQTFPVALAPGSFGFVAATSAYKAYQKQWRKLSRRDGIAFELFDTPETIAAAFDAMIELRTCRFCELNREDLLNIGEVRDFYRAMALLPEGERVVRIAGLKVGDAYTSYIYMMDHGGKFSTVISAIDNTIGNAYAPGLILFTKIFEHAVEAGYAFGDMGIGYMHYKTRFAARKNPLFIWERALSLQGGLYLTGLKAARQLKQWAKQNDTVRSFVETIRGRKIGVPEHTAKVEAAEDE